MGFSNEFILQILIYIVSFVFAGGVIVTKLKYIEKKQDKHNELIERMYIVESSANVAHARIDEIKKQIENNEKR